MSRPLPDPTSRPHLGRLAGVAAFAAAAALALLAISGSASARSSDDIQAAAIKVAFVYNFAKFASWPLGRFRGLEDALNLCVQRGDLRLEALQSLQGKQIGDRPVDVTIVHRGDAVGTCHLLFASSFASIEALQGLLALARRDGILMVSDLPEFASLGGHIGLVEDRGRLRFQINLRSLTDADLKLSSQLLNLAEIVGPVRN